MDSKAVFLGPEYREVGPYEPRGGLEPVGFEHRWCEKCGSITPQVIWIDGLECCGLGYEGCINK